MHGTETNMKFMIENESKFIDVKDLSNNIQLQRDIMQISKNGHQNIAIK